MDTYVLYVYTYVLYMYAIACRLFLWMDLLETTIHNLRIEHWITVALNNGRKQKRLHLYQIKFWILEWFWKVAPKGGGNTPKANESEYQQKKCILCSRKIWCFAYASTPRNNT